MQEDVELRVRLEEVEKERDDERKEKESLSAALEVATNKGGKLEEVNNKHATYNYICIHLHCML